MKIFKNKYFWILLAVGLCGVGGISFALYRRKEKELPLLDTLKVDATYLDSINPSEYLAPITTQNTASSQSSSQIAPILEISNPQVQAAISIKATNIEATPSLNAAIRKRYGIGQNFYLGISEECQAFYKKVFSKISNSLDKNNLSEYPIYSSKYQSNPDLQMLLSELKTLKKKYPNYTSLSKLRKEAKMSEFGNIYYLGSIGLNLATGERLPDIENLNKSELEFLYGSNGVTSDTALLINIQTLITNWISETERFEKMLIEEAINILLREGWRISGYSSPTTEELY